MQRQSTAPAGLLRDLSSSPMHSVPSMKTLRRQASETSARGERLLRARNDATLTRISNNLKSGLLRMTTSVSSTVRRRAPSVQARAKAKEDERRIESERRHRARLAVKEAMHYLIFLGVMTWVALWDNDTSQERCRITNGVEAQLFEREQTVDLSARGAAVSQDRFRDVSSVSGIHDWLEGPLHWALWTRHSFDSASVTNVSLPTTLGHAVVLGAVRVSQVRSGQVDDPSECNIPSAFTFTGTIPRQWTCAPDTGGGISTVRPKFVTTPFGGASGSLFKSDDNAKLVSGASSEPAYWSYSTRWWYPVSSYAVLLPNPLYNLTHFDTERPDQKALQTLKSLRTNHYIDRHTRVLHVDASLHSPSISVTTMVRASFEVLPSGTSGDDDAELDRLGCDIDSRCGTTSATLRSEWCTIWRMLWC